MNNADIESASATILSLLANRVADATLCPSEAARALAVENRGMEWRAAMPVVHTAVDGLPEKGAVRLRWKGQPVYPRSGPYRMTLSDKVMRNR